MGIKEKCLCAKCKKEYTNDYLIQLIKRRETGGKILTKLCEDCYLELLEFLEIKDVEV